MANLFNGLRAFLVGVAKLLLALFCIGLLGLAPLFAVAGHVEIAATFAGLFVLSIATLSLPRLQSFEGFSMKLQLKEEIRKAEITLDQLKILARSSARQGFLQVRGLPISERREMVSALNDTITAANLTDFEAASLRRPLMDAVARDLLQLGQLAAAHLHAKAVHAVEGELKALGARITGASLDVNEPRRTELENEKRRLMDMQIPGRIGPITPESLDLALDGCLAPFARSAEDDTRLRSVLDSARRIMRECVDAKTITSDFEAIARFLFVHTPGFVARNDHGERAEGLLNSRFGREQANPRPTRPTP